MKCNFVWIVEAITINILYAISLFPGWGSKYNVDRYGGEQLE